LLNRSPETQLFVAVFLSVPRFSQRQTDYLYGATFLPRLRNRAESKHRNNITPDSSAALLAG
jgi:hypothetical protein